jgi:tetratricopeptide (TPR) repeat protein
MPDADIAELVNEATVSTPLRPHELDLVVLRAGGNPLHATEIIRAARAAGSFEAVPDSLEAAIAAQVDALDPEARQLLRYATVLGRRFRRSDLDELLKAEGLAMDDGALSRLESFLVPDGETGMHFREGLLRKTIYEGLAYRLRVRLHREAGEAMERLAKDPEDIADSLAIHFSIAGDHERTWRYGRVAAERAARAYANADAARLFRVALDASRRLDSIPAPERIETLSRLGYVCRSAGTFDEALEAYREAGRIAAGDREARARLQLLRAATYERKSQFTTALRELSVGRKLLAGLESLSARKCLARIDSFAATIRLAQDRFKDTLREARRAEAEARECDERAALAAALTAADSAEGALGGNATARMREALAIYQELGDLDAESSVRCNLGVAAYQQGKWTEAVEWFEGYRETATRAGNVVNAAQAGSNLGEMLVRRGQLDEAMPILRDVARVMRASGFTDGAAYAEVQIGRLLVQRDRHREADELLDRARTELQQLGRATSALEAACVQAEARAFLGRGPEALALLETAARAAGENARMFAPQVAAARVQALVSMGRKDEARKLVDEGLRTAREFGMPYEEALLLSAKAELDRRHEKGPRTEDVAALEKILTSLGVQSIPRLVDQAN